MNRNFLLRQEIFFLILWKTNYLLHDLIFIVFSKCVHIVGDHLQFLFYRLSPQFFFVTNVSHSRAAFGLMNPINLIYSRCTALNSSLDPVIKVIACFFLNEFCDEQMAVMVTKKLLLKENKYIFVLHLNYNQSELTFENYLLLDNDFRKLFFQSSSHKIDMFFLEQFHS